MGHKKSEGSIDASDAAKLGKSEPWFGFAKRVARIMRPATALLSGLATRHSRPIFFDISGR